MRCHHDGRPVQPVRRPSSRPGDAHLWCRECSWRWPWRRVRRRRPPGLRGLRPARRPCYAPLPIGRWRHCRWAPPGPGRPARRGPRRRPGPRSREPNARCSRPTTSGTPRSPACRSTPKSATWLASMDASTTYLHPDYGPSGDPSNPYGIPWQIVPPAHALRHRSASPTRPRAIPGPYPFGAATPIEGGQNATGDRHAIMVDPSTCTLYELYDAHYHAPAGVDGRFGRDLEPRLQRPAAGRLDLRRRRRTADPAGTGQLRRGGVGVDGPRHPLHRRLHPAVLHLAGPARGGPGRPDCPPMGARFRLDASFTPSGVGVLAPCARP